MKGVVVGECDSYDEALSDVTSAIKFHIDTFGKDAFSDDEIIDTRVAEVVVWMKFPYRCTKAAGEGKEISRFTFSWDGGLQLSGRISTV
jgi:hypothetical protein